MTHTDTIISYTLVARVSGRVIKLARRDCLYILCEQARAYQRKQAEHYGRKTDLAIIDRNTKVIVWNI